jgi:Cu2+-exporting ATPase
VKKIIFDKTGTLTLETMALLDPDELASLSPEEKSALLTLVQDNLHPVSCCLRELLLAEGVEPAALPRPAETIGSGLEIQVEGSLWRLGRPGWAGQGRGDALFTRNGEMLASFCFCEEVRPDAAGEIAALRREGRDIYILSGDRPAKVSATAVRLDLPATHCLAEMSPERKASWVKAKDKQDTLVIGDGANDSLAFDHAWASGTPAIDRGLLEHKADFYFLGRGLNGIRSLFAAAALRRLTNRRVTGFAIAYNAVAITLCLAGVMRPLLAAILMPLSSLVSLAIVFTSMRRSSR